ncbi:MAG TPA: efflux RND transporter periplasmic adaptor subunit [Candidatus Eisenbacteria bacterium]
MAEGERKGPPRAIRPIVLLLVVGTVGFFIWRNATRREDYTGGDVVTTGTIEAVRVGLGFKITGRILEVPVSEGDDVSPGETVARLETEDLDLAIRTARAALESARAAALQARATRDGMARDLARQRALIASGSTTQQALEAARTADDVAAAQVEAARAQVHQAESAVAQALLQRTYADLRAPSAGVVSEVIHRAGELVTVATPVVTIAEMDTVKVLAAVDETRVGAVRPGDKVSVRVYTFDRTRFEGRVTDIRPAGDFATRKDWGAERRDIRTFTVTARVPNPERLLKDGMTAEITILVSPSVKEVARAKP